MAQYEVTLRDYWRILRRRKGIVMFTAVLLGSFSFIVSSIWQPIPIFKAGARVQIDPNAGDSASLFMEYGIGASDIETQMAILTSFRVMERVATKLGFLEFATTSEETARVVLSLPSRIETQQQGQTNIIAVSVVDRDPVLARDFANTVVEMFRDYDYEIKNQKTVKHRKFVEAQLLEAREKLQRAEEEVRVYRERTELISLQAQTSVTLQLITQAERLIQAFEGDVRGIDSMLEEMKGQDELSEEFMQGASSARVGATFMGFSRQLNLFRLQRDGLLVKFTESHPEVKELDVKMIQLRSAMVDELSQRKRTIGKELESEVDRLRTLRLEYKELPTSGLELSRLEREVLLRQEVVGALEDRHQIALSQEADKVEGVAILQWAITPTSPTNLHPKLSRAFMGFALGILLGVVFAVLAETLDTSIGTIEDVQEYIHTQVVGVIPYIDVEHVRASLERRGRDPGDDRAVQRKAQLVSYFDPQSTLAETYRTLRTNIEFVTVEKEAKSLMVTSSSFVEGKSTTIANLAMSMAQLGRRTLLVDADMRKPSLARLFGLDKEPGLTEIIIGNNHWPETVRTLTDIVTGGMGLEDILQTQGISNLHIITSGTIPPNPAELLNSNRMTEFIGEIREEYDMVLFDSPPVLQVTDAAILGKKLEGTLMIYKAGDIPRTSLKRSTDLLRSMDIELVGVVLNGISADTSTDYQDLGYGAYYAYGVDVPARAVSFTDRFRGRLDEWKRGRQERGSDDEILDSDDTDDFDGAAHGKRTPALALVSYIAIGLSGLGLAWQSGYLKKPLGAIPVVEWYESRESSEQRRSDSAVIDVQENIAPALFVPTADDEAPSRVVSVSLRQQETKADQDDVQRATPASPPALAEDSPAARIRDGTPVEPVSGSGRPEAVSAQDEKAQSDDSRYRRETLEFAGPTIAGPLQPYAIRAGSYPPLSKWAQGMLEALRREQEEAFLSPVKVRGRRLDRLLVGNFGSWEEAYEQARKLQDRGLVEEFAILRLPFAIQLSDVPDRQVASKRVRDLEKLGFSTYLQASQHGSWRLLAGAFSSSEEAESALTALPSEMGPGRVTRR